MKTQEIERVIANKIADHWYNEIHGKTAPIFSKQKLRDFAESELKKLHIQRAAAVKSDWDLRKCFEQLRFDKNHHLGLGDIRLTIAQQEEICELVERFYRCR